jgi:hypothetical protein
LKLVTGWLAGAALALAGEGSAAAEPAALALELNKLERTGEACRVYLSLRNDGDVYDSFKLDLVLFGTDGIIARRLTAEIGPLRARKRTVKLFDVPGLDCGGIGSVLVNDVLECRPLADSAECLHRLQLSSRAPVELMR